MTFDYDIENEEGEVVATYRVEATFSPEAEGFTSGRPEDCYPTEGGDLEDLVVYLGDVDVTENLTEKTYCKIRDYARERLR
jgi:hypothetical protein